MKLLLIGPSKNLESFSLEDFENYRKEGYTTISYSDSITRLKEINFKPDYYSFYDIETIKKFPKEDSFLNDIQLLVGDIFDESIDKDLAFDWFKNFKQVHKIKVDKYPTVNAIESTPSDNASSMSISGVPHNTEITKDDDKYINFYDEYYLFKPTFVVTSHQTKMLHTDKFSCYLLPLVLHYFRIKQHYTEKGVYHPIIQNIEKINCIGFGDFDVNRGWGTQSKDGYEDYKETFDVVAPYLVNFFSEQNIELEFLGNLDNNYYLKKILSMLNGEFEMEKFYKGKKVLITGGTGSLGKALIKRLQKIECQLIVYSRDEGKQALSFGNDPSIIRVIGDVRDLDKLDVTMKRHKPDYVIHTGALKRIDDMEFYPDECVKTNIQGSENVAIASQNNGVKKCILISTDKACQPVNVYGSSKFIAERIFTNYDYNSDSTIFSSVRYGNVIASRGSFIPIWMDLLSEGKKLKVTSMQMTRFLFTLDDAVETVLKSLYYAEGGEVFIPKINSFEMKTIIEAVKRICDLDSIEYDVIGIRPGEKLHEDMLAKTELEFTYQPDDKLLTVIPQYTKKNHSYRDKYNGEEFNSSLHTNDNVDDLCDLIKRGINE